ncbi:hypothetical protein PAXRUDRAFT_832058 [Paxillus rubicundulus Ve08.2h10]|uniref:Uncharacterized protein n=1 Tax=Paxillus rubicundulus Ve08.2h10 TaxID=930991 RepID=A0A0D0DT91_9AGAM|nr:hypothetical protein PAXRUDRAFT_832058 [Paxillus rubicundulus Ve08.2h10]
MAAVGPHRSKLKQYQAIESASEALMPRCAHNTWSSLDRPKSESMASCCFIYLGLPDLGTAQSDSVRIIAVLW